MDTSSMPDVRTFVDGRALEEIELLRWEATRGRAARGLLLERLGGDATVTLLQSDLDASAALARRWVETSDGRRAPSITEVEARGGTAGGFLHWLHERFAAGDHATLNGACPDHFALRPGPNGWMDVTETVGGWGGPIRFYVVVTGVEADAPGPLDPTLPHRLIGRIRGIDGTEYGRVLHQFGDVPGGFRARLGVWWPAAAPRELVVGHQWHLACEFDLWVRGYLGSAA